MLFMHEVHKVRGRREDDFEAAFRQGWMPTLAAGDDARLLWYADHAQGSGPSYTVVTVTAVRDGAAWERLALQVQRGDLQPWARELDDLRYDVEAKLLAPLPWSPLQEIPLGRCRSTGGSTNSVSTWKTPCGPIQTSSRNTSLAAATCTPKASRGRRQCC